MSIAEDEHFSFSFSISPRTGTTNMKYQTSKTFDELQESAPSGAGVCDDDYMNFVMIFVQLSK